MPPHVYVFIDEAYHHFTSEASEYSSFIDHPIDNPRLIVGRTLSKVYGLAGMRLGYAISSPEVISKMKLHSLSFSMNIAALKGASIVLKSDNELQKRIKKLTDERQNFYKQARARNVRFIPSYGNFVMLETGPYSVQKVIDHFKSHKIIIGREFPSMKEHVRISLGSPDDMSCFWKTWDLLFKKKTNK